MCCSPWGHKDSDTTERLSSKCEESSELLGAKQSHQARSCLLEKQGEVGAAQEWLRTQKEKLPWAGL